MTTMTMEQDTAVNKAHDKHHTIAKRLNEVRQQIGAVTEAITSGEERLPTLMAEEILTGRSADERCASLEAQLAGRRDELRRLQTEEKALTIAEREAGKAVQAAEAHAKQQAAEYLLNEIRQTVRKLDGVLTQAERLNDRLCDLDAECKAVGLSDAGGKALVLLSRSGARWTALDRNYVGMTTTLLGWRQHVLPLIDMN
jgi:chromosome segregation ATPase